MKISPERMEEEICRLGVTSSSVRRYAQSIPFRGKLIRSNEDDDMKTYEWAAWTAKFLTKPTAVQQRMLNVTAVRIKQYILPLREMAKCDTQRNYVCTRTLYGRLDPRTNDANVARLQAAASVDRLKRAILKI